MKVIFNSDKVERRYNTVEAKKERSAIDKLTKPRVSVAFRRAVAANVPVTYISRGAIIRIEDGEKTVIGRVEQSSKYVTK